MATQCWIDPANPRNKVFVLDTVGPKSSPAPVGNGTLVPAGYVKQLGADGFKDTGGIRLNGVDMPNVTMTQSPFYTGVLAPVIGYDPASGRPYHTKPSYNANLGVID